MWQNLRQPAISIHVKYKHCANTVFLSLVSHFVHFLYEPLSEPRVPELLSYLYLWFGFHNSLYHPDRERAKMTILFPHSECHIVNLAELNITFIHALRVTILLVIFIHFLAFIYSFASVYSADSF